MSALLFVLECGGCAIVALSYPAWYSRQETRRRQEGSDAD